MSGKVLFIDDEYSKGDIISLVVSRLVRNNIITEDQVKIANNFEDAVTQVMNIKNGKDYSWIFIDRKLCLFNDIKDVKGKEGNKIEVNNIKFTKSFFDSLDGFEGDYLYFLLRKNGVPLEKICFLTANNPEDSNEESSLKTSHFIFDNDIPRIIVKQITEQDAKKPLIPADENDENEGGIASNDHEILYKLIADTLDVQISFKYRDFFDNKDVNNIFSSTDLLNKFKKILVDVENNVCPKTEDGVILRIMLEFLVAEISGQNKLDVRSYLNKKGNLYKIEIEEKIEIDEDWLKTFNHYEYLPNVKDKKRLINYYSKSMEMSDAEAKAEKIISDSVCVVMNILYSYYSNKWNEPTNLPPKYIFSCIDNIYTITSEWSSHGKNLKKTDELTFEGWKAIVYGMVQILQWFAKRH